MQFSPTTREYLEAACIHGGIYSIEDVENSSDVDTTQVWESDSFAFLTNIIETPAGKRLEIWLAGGDLQGILAMEPAVAEFAKQNDCVSVDLNGRLGWQKFLPEYKPHSVTLRKELYV